MNKKLIIKNLKDCFDLGMTFKQLAYCEENAQTYKVDPNSKGFYLEFTGLSTFRDELELFFEYQGSRTLKDGTEYMYFEMEVPTPF